MKDTEEDRETASQWVVWMRKQWSGHGLTTLNQQKNPMTEVRRALKDQLSPDHIIFDYMQFTENQWIEINLQAAPTPIVYGDPLIKDPDTIVHRATQLLNSRQWADSLAGLTAVTGRRCAELLKTATFAYQSPVSIWLTGATKAKQKEPLSFELPTLAPAQQVLDIISKVRKLVDTTGMNNRQINAQYEADVVTACDRTFWDLLDHERVEGNIYNHLSRTVYARIATLWYAPPQILDIDFMAAIQGHTIILGTNDLEDKKALAEKRHYFDYQIGTQQGQIDSRQGIRLSDPDVSFLENFQGEDELAPKIEDTPVPNPVMSQPSASSIRVYKKDRQRLMKILEAYGIEGTRPEQMSAFISEAEQKLKQTQLLEKGVKAFIKSLKALETPEEIRDLVLKEIAKFEDYPDFFGTYRNEIQDAVRSCNLPLVDGKTALRSQNVKEGVTYEQRKHFALLFLDNPDMTLQAPESLVAPNNGTPTPSATTTDQKLDIITDTLTQLCQLMLQQQQQSVQQQPNVVGQTIPLSQPPAPAKKRGRGRLDPEEADAKIHRAIDAIMAFNDTANRPQEEMWRIGISSLKRLTSSSQSVIQRVCKKRKKDIDAHHEKHNLGKYHNLPHGHAGIMIDDVIAWE
ncbi:protelomerase family protein [Acaryochloris sp. CCMEE 5410]|uniref:protelomerase family protein n=1 Tax=Acaryochloris sp. CCMEE 5410 TaxID=310037 RepID=UPI0002485157|nr:protelomerase family protein [Acaryochloris sp. CCMEE 5410]